MLLCAFSCVLYVLVLYVLKLPAVISTADESQKPAGRHSSCQAG